MWKHRNSEMVKKMYKKPIKGHFFMFKTWRRSMAIRYMINAICIIIMGVILQYIMISFVNEALRWYEYSPEYYSKLDTLERTSTTDPNYSTAKSEFESIETIALGIASNNYMYL